MFVCRSTHIILMLWIAICTYERNIIGFFEARKNMSVQEMDFVICTVCKFDTNDILNVCI